MKLRPDWERKAYEQERRATLTGRAQELFNNARTRAKKRDHPFTITREWVVGALTSGHCAVTGLPFRWETRSPHAPSIDQIDPALGYTPENTRLVVAIFNYAKNVWDDDTVLNFAHAYIQRSSANGP